MKNFHPHYNDYIHINEMNINEINDINKKIVQLHMNNMLNHRKLILKFLSRISIKKLYENDDVIYNNNFILSLKGSDFDLLSDEYYDDIINQFKDSQPF